MKDQIIAWIWLLAFAAVGYYAGCRRAKRQHAVGWFEGCKYEQELAKKRRDKRGRWKNSTDKNQFTATI